VLALVLVGATCAGAGALPGDTTGTTLTVAPDHEARPFVAYVTFVDGGTEPATLFLPAGRKVRLIIKSRVPEERHFRVGGLIVSDLLWLVEPEYTLEELQQMSPEEQAALDFDPTQSVADHTEHHLQATFVPTKPESPAGIKPIGNEVHGYTPGVGSDTLLFYPLTTGTYQAEDVLHPEYGTTKVVVFLPDEHREPD
jgi:hypothetical protein